MFEPDDLQENMLCFFGPGSNCFYEPLTLSHETVQAGSDSTDMQ